MDEAVLPGWLQVVSAALGLLGAVLGVLATWSGLTRDSPRIKVHAVWIDEAIVGGRNAFLVSRNKDAVENRPNGRFGVEAINTGYVAVRIREVGVCSQRSRWFQWLREFPDPVGRGPVFEDALGKFTLPYELAPGARMLIAFAKSAVEAKQMSTARRVYVMSEDDRLFLGKSKLLAALVDNRAGKTNG